MSDEKMRAAMERSLSEYREGLEIDSGTVLDDDQENAYRDGWTAGAAHSAETIARLEEEKAVAQADNVRLREALNDIASPNSNHEIFTNAPAGMTLDRMYEEIAHEALAQPLDTFPAKKI